MFKVTIYAIHGWFSRMIFDGDVVINPTENVGTPRWRGPCMCTTMYTLCLWFILRHMGEHLGTGNKTACRELFQGSSKAWRSFTRWPRKHGITGLYAGLRGQQWGLEGFCHQVCWEDAICYLVVQRLFMFHHSFVAERCPNWATIYQMVWNHHHPRSRFSSEWGSCGWRLWLNPNQSQVACHTKVSYL